MLINTTRGPLIDHGALAKALVDGAIAGAALFLWSGVMYFGRLIPWGKFTP